MPTTGDRRGHLIYHWKHGWIPLDHFAALSKAHGSQRGAAQYLPGGRHDTVDIRRLSDEQLSGHLGNVADNEHAADRILAELDRRDRVGAQREKRKAREAAAKDAHYENLVASGENPETAYSKAYGVSEARMQRDSVISSLRGSGYKGRGLDELIGAAHTDHVYQSWLDAENTTRGHLVNKAGQAAGVDPRTLFTGPEARARKYASPELLDYWQAHGRLTREDFKAGLLGGAMRSTGTAAFA